MLTLNCKGRLITADVPVVMGILNITPDSFYDNSRFSDTDDVLKKVDEMIRAGAGMIDIGGQSTRPGSKRINSGEESARVKSVIETIHYHFPDLIISIDTYHANVAKVAVEAGASVVNDISGGMMDANMINTVAMLRVPFICTHMKGTPDTMQQNPRYDDVVTEIIDFFIERIALCKKAGIHDLIIDPGFGFGKTIDHNFTLLSRLEEFRLLDKPLLLGVSRKGTIYKTLGVTAAEALNGTTVLHTIGLMKGASILRVHDVKEACETVTLTCKVQKPEQ
ncbi:MAG: dihydropteroate synthase [Chitinophagaceae bacterium]|nr:MAG: dihydropteroate synthase [Chitinophagaceae bacterium]